MSAALLSVGIGDVRIGRPGDVLDALLGSCVAVGILWPQGQCCALAHCLLPQSPQPGWAMGARYVNQALPSLFALMGLRQRDLCEVEVVLAGGASMLGAAGVSSGIGAENIAAACRSLAASGMIADHLDVGGRRGRTLRIDCSTYRFAIAKVARNIEEFDHAAC